MLHGADEHLVAEFGGLRVQLDNKGHVTLWTDWISTVPLLCMVCGAVREPTWMRNSGFCGPCCRICRSRWWAISSGSSARGTDARSMWIHEDAARDHEQSGGKSPESHAIRLVLVSGGHVARIDSQSWISCCSTGVSCSGEATAF